MSLPIISKHTPGNDYLLRLSLILLFKHAAVLCLSGIPAKLALTQAESDYQQANMASKIKEKFSVNEVYSIEQLVDFLVDTNIEPSE